MSDLPDWTRSVAVEVNAEAPTEYWLAKNGTRVAKDHKVFGTTATLYTVPEDSELYILSAGLSMYTEEDTGAAYLYEGNEAIRKILYDTINTTGLHGRLASKVFYRAVAGEAIKLTAATGVRAWGYFVGYCMGSCEVPG